MTFFLTPDIASKTRFSCLVMIGCSRCLRRVWLGGKCIFSSLVGSFQLLQHPIAIPKLSLYLLFKSPPQRCRISRADKPRPGIDAEID